MKIEKKDINVFLALWIKNDPELWGELRDIQIKLLLQRIVKEMSFAQMAAYHKVEESKIRKIFQAILKRIEIGLGKEVAHHLSMLNDQLERRTPYVDPRFNYVFLN